jgi:hypothetical protein
VFAVITHWFPGNRNQIQLSRSNAAKPVVHFAVWINRTHFAGKPRNGRFSDNMRIAHVARLSPDSACSDRHYVVRTGTFLSLANIKLDILTVIQCCVVITTLDFRMMDEKIFATIFRGNETVSFSGVKPLDCTFTHNLCFSLD